LNYVGANFFLDASFFGFYLGVSHSKILSIKQKYAR
jgi:hypothetical protein